MAFYKPGHKHIHSIIRKHAPRSTKKVRHLFHFKYEKTFLFLFFIFISYIIFHRPEVQTVLFSLSDLSYLSFLIAGILFSFGFSAPISIGFLIVSHPQNIISAIIFASLGSVVANLLLFKTIKSLFRKEFQELESEKVISLVEGVIKKNKNVLIRHYLIYIFAGVLLATPLPDEIGISMLAGLTTIKPFKLAVLSFIVHSIALFFILYIGALI